MKIKGIYIFILIICLGTGLVVIKKRGYIARLVRHSTPNRLVTSDESVAAVFSFSGEEALQTDPIFAHYKLILTDPKRLGIDLDLEQTVVKVRPLIISVETWGSNLSFPFKKDPLSQVINGGFDSVIIQLCQRLTDKPARVYLRFNPEMEVPSNTYPWQYGPIEYIKAFRHFSQLCKQYAPQVAVVWAPAGYPGAMEFYPGDDLVAATSITAKSISESGLNVYPREVGIF